MNIGKMYSEAYSTSSLQGTEHAFSFNFIVCRELVMAVNIPIQKRKMLFVVSLLAMGV